MNTEKPLHGIARVAELGRCIPSRAGLGVAWATDP